MGIFWYAWEIQHHYSIISLGRWFCSFTLNLVQNLIGNGQRNSHKPVVQSLKGATISWERPSDFEDSMGTDLIVCWKCFIIHNLTVHTTGLRRGDQLNSLATFWQISFFLFQGFSRLNSNKHLFTGNVFKVPDNEKSPDSKKGSSILFGMSK